MNNCPPGFRLVTDVHEPDPPPSGARFELQDARHIFLDTAPNWIAMTKSLRLAASCSYSIVKEPSNKNPAVRPRRLAAGPRTPASVLGRAAKPSTAVAVAPDDPCDLHRLNHHGEESFYLPQPACQADWERISNFLPGRSLPSDAIGADGVRTRDL